MIIAHNLSAQNAIRHMNRNNGSSATSMQRLSSGLRVNSAKDDAAGLSISESMRAQIRGLTQASRNAQDGISLAQTAEGTLNEVHSMLQRMRELAVQATNDTNDTNNKMNLYSEFSQLSDEIDTICRQAQFNGQYLFVADSPLMSNNNAKTEDGTGTDTDAKTIEKGFKFQVGANEGEVVNISLGEVKLYKTTYENGVAVEDKDGKELKSIDAGSLGVSTGLFQIKFFETKDDDGNVKTAYENCSEAITRVNDAINCVSQVRSKLGAVQNRMEYRVNADNNTAENLQAAESRIRDTDMAEEMTKFTQSNILTQAAQAMLAQANQQPQNVLSLLR